MPSPVAQAEALITAIETLKRLEESGQAPTETERAQLAAYPGAGCVALQLFPDPTTKQYESPAWEKRGQRLRALCTDEEYQSLLRSTFSAFYTSPLVMEAALAILHRLGVPDTARVLEPGCGVGNFLARAPEDWQFTGIELDRLSARIALRLYPHHDIRQGDMTGCALPIGKMDAAVGNVPFAEVRADYNGQRLALHEVCLVRTLDCLKPGGVAVLVITHSFLDRQQATFRDLVARKARLVGAIRLPSSAFEDQGTSVVADIVVFQKHLDGDVSVPVGDAPDWRDSLPLPIEGVEVPISMWFHDNPALVLGTWSHKDRLYGSRIGYSVTAPADLGAALLEAIGTLPMDVVPAVVSTEEDAEEDVGTTVRPLPDGVESLPVGSLYVDTDGTICQREQAGGVEVVYQRKVLSARAGTVGKRVAKLIRLREQAREVLRRQHTGAPPAERQSARAVLGMIHSVFTAEHGAVNKTTVTTSKDGGISRRQNNLTLFRDDPDSALVCALEHYDEDDDTVTRADIFHKDVVGMQEEVSRVDSAEAALLASLNMTGSVDLPLMADLYGRSVDVILFELGDLLYQDPETRAWIAADEYLSGNVRVKLQAAQRGGPAYQRNVTALQDVQPPDLMPSEIDAHLGAPWIPTSDLEQFLRDISGASAYWRLQITHVAKEAVYSIAADWRFADSLPMRTTYGTGRVGGVQLLEDALNQRIPTVRDAVDGGKSVVNLPETIAAREKQTALKEEFSLWVWKDPQRADRLIRIYNDRYNAIRLREFDGSHLTFPGMSPSITLAPHQKNAVWRILGSAGNTLLGHCVGAGKTYEMVAAGMKLRQAGRVKKPLYVVPNHMLGQFIREALQLYPNARFLLAPSESMSKRKRKLLTARMTTGDWDGIITTHSGFGRMGMSPQYYARYLRDMIAEFEAVLTEMDDFDHDKGRRNIRKQLEKRKARYEERLEALLDAEEKDDGLRFDDIGIDFLFIDEAQFFKNLETPSKLQNVSGIQTQGSGRATDLLLKLRYLRDVNPRQSVCFATGTPISNTMVEMYTLQRYLDPAGLEAAGIAHFDAWAATFGVIEEVMEIGIAGNLRARQRFAKFVNLAELQKLFRQFADIKTQQQLQLAVPRVVGGKAQVITCPMSPVQRAILDELVERYEKVCNKEVHPSVDNALKITTDGRKLALDARLVSPWAGVEIDSKLQVCAAQVYDLWRQYAEERATQLIFCDMGVTKTPWGFSVYQALVDLLVRMGIPAEEVRCIQEASTDAEKHALFQQVREGKVRILIGSTQKMGTGTNVQQRLIALHHLDAPWKPAEIEQREGRIVRQGNRYAEVYLYTYVTEGSFDAYMWQTLQTKAGFIGQVMHGSLFLREVQDVDEQALTYAEVKALATGNPAMLVFARLEAECRKLRILQQHHEDGMFRAQRQLTLIPDELTRYRDRQAGLQADLAQLAATTPDDPWMIEGQAYTREEAELHLTEWALTLKATGTQMEIPIGTFRGLQVHLQIHHTAHPLVLIRGQVPYTAPIDNRFGLGRSIVRAVERLLEAYPLYAHSLAIEIERSEGLLTRYAQQQEAPWPHTAYAQQLNGYRQELATALRAAPPEGTREVSAILADLQAAQAAHTTTTTSTPHDTPTRVDTTALPLSAMIQARREAQTTEAAA